MKILIRADGGLSVGMGHIMRSLVLADKLKKFAEVIYICKSGKEFESGIYYVREKGYRVIQIRRENLIKDILALEGDCLITDSYDVNEEYFNITRERFLVTGYIDDMNKYYFNVDFLINQNVYAEDMDYYVNEDTVLFLGPKYVLLRDEFLNIPARNIRENINDVMVTIGGSDNLNLTAKIVNLITSHYSNLRLHVVVGPAFIFKEQLKSLYSDKVKIYYNPNMSELMLKCDLAISACGSTVYELAACGTPTIGIIVADNQRLAAEKLEKLRVISYSKNIEQIISCIKDLDFNTRVLMSKKGQNIFDGQGAKRLAQEIKTILLNKI